MPSGDMFRSAVMMAVAPPLVYCMGLLFFERELAGRLPWPGPWLVFVALTGAVIGVAANAFVRRSVLLTLTQSVELVVRYCLALLLIEYALNKLIPGQFLLYNRDLDLPLRELPARRLAWHFLGYSKLYNGFVASIELLAGVLLCARRSIAGGTLLSLVALIHVVVVDIAFGIRGALPIATVMACAALALVLVHLDMHTVETLVWRRPKNVFPTTQSVPSRILWMATLTVVFGFPLYMNLATRGGLDGQFPTAGRWEVLGCQPNPGLAMCNPQGGGRTTVLYIEVGMWGQLVTGSERRDLAFSYDKARTLLEVRIVRSKEEPQLVLNGTVNENDTTVILNGHAAGLEPFQVHLRRTHWAPWPPVRAF